MPSRPLRAGLGFAAPGPGAPARLAARRLRDLLGGSYDEEALWGPLRPGIPPLAWFYKHSRAFHRLTLLALSIVSCLLLCPFSRPAKVAFGALLLFAVLLRAEGRARARGLRCVRTPGPWAREEEPLLVRYRIWNEGRGHLGRLVFADSFDGSRERLDIFGARLGLAPGAEAIVERRRPCDAGMGLFPLGPLRAVVTDSLGVFEYVLEWDRRENVPVYPKIVAVPDLAPGPSRDSLRYGAHEVLNVGSSVSFIGIRDYVRGDPLRTMAWRPSARRGELVVKEFDRTVNADVCISLEMDGRVHVGRGVRSTWETAKDLALGIVEAERAKHNNVTFLTNELVLPLGPSVDDFDALIRRVHVLSPKVSPESPEHFVDRWASTAAPGTTLVYVLPVLGPDPRGGLQSLLRARALGLRVIAILIDAGSFLDGVVHGAPFMAIAGTLATSKAHFRDAILEFQREGIRVLATGWQVPLHEERPGKGARK